MRSRNCFRAENDWAPHQQERQIQVGTVFVLELIWHHISKNARSIAYVVVVVIIIDRSTMSVGIYAVACTNGSPSDIVVGVVLAIYCRRWTSEKDDISRELI